MSIYDNTVAFRIHFDYMTMAFIRDKHTLEWEGVSFNMGGSSQYYNAKVPNDDVRFVG